MGSKIIYVKTFIFYSKTALTLSHPEALPWRVKSYSVRQSKLTKGTVLAGLGEKGLIQLTLSHPEVLP